MQPHPLHGGRAAVGEELESECLSRGSGRDRQETANGQRHTTLDPRIRRSRGKRVGKQAGESSDEQDSRLASELEQTERSRMYIAGAS